MEDIDDESYDSDELEYLPEYCYMGIRPYMFEPRVDSKDDDTQVNKHSGSSSSNISDSSTDDDSDADDDSESEPDDDSDSDTDVGVSSAKDGRVGNTDWCKCGECNDMPTGVQCQCCTETAEVETKRSAGGHKCITEHSGVVANCLTLDVVHVSIMEARRGLIDEHKPIHKLYRYIAYRRFQRFIWRRLRRKHRRVLPACVVNKIREAFPPEDQAGFKYPRP